MNLISRTSLVQQVWCNESGFTNESRFPNKSSFPNESRSLVLKFMLNESFQTSLVKQVYPDDSR